MKTRQILTYAIPKQTQRCDPANRAESPDELREVHEEGEGPAPGRERCGERRDRSVQPDGNRLPRARPQPSEVCLLRLHRGLRRELPPLPRCASQSRIPSHVASQIASQVASQVAKQASGSRVGASGAASAGASRSPGIRQIAIARAFRNEFEGSYRAVPESAQGVLPRGEILQRTKAR